MLTTPRPNPSAKQNAVLKIGISGACTVYCDHVGLDGNLDDGTASDGLYASGVRLQVQIDLGKDAQKKGSARYWGPRGCTCSSSDFGARGDCSEEPCQ